MSNGGEPRARARSIEHARYPELLELLRAGHYFEPAAWSVGINPKAVRSALEHDDEANAEFEAARAEGVRFRMAQLEQSSDWKREAWLLERLAPKVFHLPTKITGVSPSDGGAPIEARALPATAAERREELRALRAEIDKELEAP